MKRAPSGRVSSLSDAELVAIHLGVDKLIDKVKSNSGGIFQHGCSNPRTTQTGERLKRRKIMELSWKSDDIVFMFVCGHTGIEKRNGRHGRSLYLPYSKKQTILS
jgi:hypothetical protein